MFIEKFSLAFSGLSAIVTFSLIPSATVLANPLFDAKNCTYKGKPLYGKVKIVENFPDFTIQVDSSFPQLKVEPVTAFPNKCGQWQFVENFPDFKVKFVESLPEIKIQFVDNFPGTRY